MRRLVFSVPASMAAWALAIGLVAGCGADAADSAAAASDGAAQGADMGVDAGPGDGGGGPGRLDAGGSGGGGVPDVGGADDAGGEGVPGVDVAAAADTGPVGPDGGVADASGASDASDASDAAGPEDAGDQDVPFCDPPIPSAEALRPMGTLEDGTRILPEGRALRSAGQEVVVEGFPIGAVTHPTLPLAYVQNTGYAKRALQVLDLETGDIVQELERAEMFHGMALAADAGTLWTTSGDHGAIERFAVGPDGLLTWQGAVTVGGYPAGLALSPDGATLWVAQLQGNAVLSIDLATEEVSAGIPVDDGPYALLMNTPRNELWVSRYGGADEISVIDLATGAVAGSVTVGGNPQGLAMTADGARIYAAVSDGDIVVAVDAATREVVGSAPVGEASIAGPDGAPLPASSPSALLLDEIGGRLLVARAADNAVALLDPQTLETEAAIPVAWYPTGLALTPDGQTLVVTNGKGIGAGPLTVYSFGASSGKDSMKGSVSIIPLAGLDLPALTAEVESNVRRPAASFPFDCDGQFPVPAQVGGKTPIEHIVLIVRENKTYDSVLGDSGLGDADPSLVLFGESVTPNLHKLAAQFANHDNFYSDAESSVQGHLWLTSSFVNDWVERTWLEDYRGNGGFATDAVLPKGQPDFGTFFTHLIAHGVSFTNYGEVVGTFGEQGDDAVVNHTDLGFPGLFYNTDVKDELKAQYVAKRLVEDGVFPAFVYVLLPNDHTVGLSTGALTPDSMVNDNDYATGLLVDAISHSPYWNSTAIFITQDDSQQGADHVDYHRSLLVVASPWAKHGHTSKVHTSFPSLFRTFELILGLPPMNRYDANATPLWDAFGNVADPAVYDAVPRNLADRHNGEDGSMAQRWSNQMDFSGPDRTPDLGAILWWARRGEALPGSHFARALAGEVPPEPSRVDLDGDDDDEEERDAFDEAWERAEAWVRAHPERGVVLPPRRR